MSGTSQTASTSPAPKFQRYDVRHFPVTAACCAIAIAITAAATSGVDIGALYEGPQVAQGQVWRLVTTAFVHLELWHILANLYWLWEFGPLLEMRFGPLRTGLLILFLAFASEAYDYGLSSGGIGLSGVVYGLFGLLLVLSKRDARFAGVLTGATLRTFVIWFFLCIALTYTGIMNVANMGHGAGFVFGVLAGLAITAHRWRRAVVSGTAVLVAVGLWTATLGREAVNLSGTLGEEEGQLGYEALVAHQDQAALRWLLTATRLRPNEETNWNNLSVAYARLGKDQAAQDAEDHAQALIGAGKTTR